MSPTHTSALAAAALAFACTALPASAHHGWAGQESDKVTTLDGKIQAVRYRNPHAQIDLVTSDNKRWLITMAPITRMEARGMTEDQLKVGQAVHIEGRRNLDPKQMEVKAERIAMGGKTTELR